MTENLLIMGVCTRRHWSLFLLCLLMAEVGIAIAASAPPKPKFPALSACSRYEFPVFESLDFMAFGPNEEIILSATELSAWRDQFHGTVDGLVEEDIGRRTGGEHSALRQPDPPLQCTANDYKGFYKPRGTLQGLASQLPLWYRGDDYPWDERTIAARGINSQNLTQLDMPAVLMEYLRMYECAHIERHLGQIVDTSSEEWRRLEALEAFGFIQAFRVVLHAGELAQKVIEQRKDSWYDLDIARVSVHRTLTLLAGINRLKLIDAELTCIQQASLDIRNGFALAADASSCLPRVWNAKDPLRDYKNPDDQW